MEYEWMGTGKGFPTNDHPPRTILMGGSTCGGWGKPGWTCDGGWDPGVALFAATVSHGTVGEEVVGRETVTDNSSCPVTISSRAGDPELDLQ